MHLTKRPGHAIEIARQLATDGVRDIVVLGGDGTIGEVVAGLVRADGSGMVEPGVRLALIHQGTGGDLVRGLGIPATETAAIETAIHGGTRTIDVGVARYQAMGSGEPAIRGFASCANVGMGFDVVTRTEGALKRLGHSAGFAIATVVSLARHRHRAVHIRIDGGLDRAMEIVEVTVANNRTMGGGMLVAPDAQLGDGMFDVVIIERVRRTHLLRVFPRIYSGRHVGDPAVTIQRTTRVAFDLASGAAPEGVVLDGEPVGSVPASFEVLPMALTVRVPAISTDSQV